MSSMLVTRIGLLKRDEASLFSHILSSSKLTFSSFFMKLFNASAFENTASNTALFPQISKSNVSNFRNTIRGLAMACAADDLELTFGGEDGQIEIFDNIGQSNPQQFRHDPMQYGMGKAGLNSAYFPNFDKPVQLDLPHSYDSSRFGIEDYSPTSYSSGQSRFPFEHSQFDRNVPDRSYGSNHTDFGLDFLASHQSHFDIMSNNIQLETQFTDFKPGSFNDGSSYGSSVESFDSPMDEMFISRPSIGFSNEVPRKTSVSSRKRKLDSPDTSNFDMVSDNVFFKNDTMNYEGQKRVKRESVARVEPVKSDFSDLHNEIFLGPPNMRFAHSTGMDIQGKPMKFEDESSKARYKCKDCDAAFKVKSYLTRHMKKHNNAKAFVCPFYREQDSEYCGTNKAGTKCHPTGGFSRKDTYKTHLKALHFIYPPRTKSSERGTQGGRCAGCFQYFESNTDWFTCHIEGGSCKGFVGQGKCSADDSTEVKVKQEMLD